MKSTTILSVPFTGLGLYGGFRGDRWLKNRIRVFETFVIPSILNQTDRDFLVWVSWRRDEMGNKYVYELKQRLQKIPNFRFVFTYSGVPMYDDKYPHDIAVERLANTMQESFGSLIDLTADADEIYVLMQPSDDCYDKNVVASVKKAFEIPDVEAVAFTKGYLCNYTTKDVLEYNPKTVPPFAAIKFNRKTFFDPARHLKYIGLKEDTDKYKAGTPLPSHEYLPQCLKTALFEGRGFLVGTHGENISTHFNHPYGGARFEGQHRDEILDLFGILNSPPVKLPISVRKWFMRQLPYGWQRKIRYWFGELLGNKIYTWLRS